MRIQKPNNAQQNNKEQEYVMTLQTSIMTTPRATIMRGSKHCLVIFGFFIFLLALQLSPSAYADNFGAPIASGPQELPEEPPCPKDGSGGGGSGGGGSGGPGFGAYGAGVSYSGQSTYSTPSGPSGPGASGTAGQPIALFDGRETHRVTDMVVNGVFPIVISRKYESRNNYDSRLGYGWGFSFDRALFEYADNSVVIRTGCGRRVRFVKTGNGYVTPTKGLLGKLIEVGDGTYTFRYLNGDIDYYDAQGRLTAIEETRGTRLEFTYDAADRKPLTGTSPYSVDPTKPMVVSYGYQLNKIEERLADGTLSGNSVSFTYNPNTGRLTSITSNDGRVVNYVHDKLETFSTGGNLVQVNGLESNVSIYKYEDPNDSHNLTFMQEGPNSTPYIMTYDPQDRTVRQQYGNSDLVITYNVDLTVDVANTITDDLDLNPYTVNTSFTFSADGYVTAYKDGLGNEFHYGYDPVTRRGNKVEIFSKTTTGLVLLQKEDYTYTAEGYIDSKVVKLDSGEIITKSWTYDNGWVSSGQVVSSADPTKIFRTEYTFFYDSSSRPTNIKETKRRKDGGSFQTTSYSYDTQGRLLTTTLPDGVKKINEYTGDFLTKTYYEVSGSAIPQMQMSYGYDAQGNRNLITDAKGNSTNLTYDDKGRVVSSTNALGEKSILTFDANDNLILLERGQTVAQGEGQVVKLVYDAKNRITELQRKNDAGIFVTFLTLTYDSDGNRLSSKDGENRVTNYKYDLLGRLTILIDPANNVTELGYDANGNRISMKDANLNETKYSYDDLNRLVSIEQLGISPSAMSEYGYDANDNLTSVKDAEGNLTQYSYDALSRRTAEIKPLTQALNYFYDNRNRVDYMLNARGQKIDYNYESWGQLKTVEFYANNIINTPKDRTVLLARDNNGNLTGVIDDAIQSTALYTITRDALNRPDLNTIKYISGGDRILNYDYDRYNNRSKLTFIDGVDTFVHDYNYNKLNQLESAFLPGTQNYVLNYYNNDYLKTLMHPNALSTAYLYDANGPVKSITTTGIVGQIEQFAYTYDNLRNIDTQTDKNGLHDYNYDGLNRLTYTIRPVVPGLINESYVYDKVGNRELSSDASLYDYDNNNRMSKSPGLTYSYDDDGNTLSRTDGSLFGYDKNNRLLSFSKASITASYQYGPTARRLSKIVNGNKTWFLWDGDDLIAEFNNTGIREKRYAYFNEDHAPVQVQDINGIYTVHTDHLDTPRYLTDSSQQVIWRSVQQSFGQATVDEDVDNNAVNVTFNVRFPGQYYDAESGLHYNFFRDYDPSTGRYVQSDPIGLDGGLNTYGYVGGNPLYWIDPLGLANQNPNTVSFGGGGPGNLPTGGGGGGKGYGGGGGGSTNKGPSGKVSTKKYLEKNWDKGTFPTKQKSIDYHLEKHGKGLSPTQFTQKGQQCFNNPNAAKSWAKDKSGNDAIKVWSSEGTGLFTPKGKIIWFHPK